MPYTIEEILLETRKCQLLVDHFTNAIKRCDVEEQAKGKFSNANQFNIEVDLNRNAFIDLMQKNNFNDYKNLWLNYIPVENNKYSQDRIDGSSIPGSKNTIHFTFTANLLGGNYTFDVGTLSFAYIDDSGIPCAFTLCVSRTNPSIWFATVTTNITAADNERQVFVFIPEYSTALYDRDTVLNPDNIKNIITNIDNSKDTLENCIKKNMTIDKPHLFNMDLLNDLLGYALNSHSIQYLLEEIFDMNGNIQEEPFKQLIASIQNGHLLIDKYNNLDHDSISNEIPLEKRNVILHRSELNQIRAALMHKRNDNETAAQLISDIAEAIDNYTTESYQIIMNHDMVKALANTYKQLTSRQVDVISRSDHLFSDRVFSTDDFESQNLRLTLLLSSYPDSPLAKCIKEFQQKINESFLNSFGAGLSTESLTKDLNALCDLFISPDAENFAKYAERIVKSKHASQNRKNAAAILTVGGLASLATAAGATAVAFIFPVVSVPVIVSTLAGASLGMFAGTAGTGGAVYTAKKRENYGSNLQDVQDTFIANNEKQWTLAKLSVVTGEDTVLDALRLNIERSENSYVLCNLLAETIRKTEKSNVTLSNSLKEIRDIILDKGFFAGFPLKNNNNDSPEPQAAGEGKEINLRTMNVRQYLNIADLQQEYRTKNAALPADENARNVVTNRLEELVAVINCKRGITTAIETLNVRVSQNSSLQRPYNPVRDNILIKLLKIAANESNRDSLTTHLDDAVFALFADSANSKTGIDLLTLRNKLMPPHEEVPVLRHGM